jgi:leucyl aminopeptidase
MFRGAIVCLLITMPLVNSFFSPLARFTKSYRRFSSVTADYVASDRFTLNLETTSSLDFQGDLLIVPFYKPRGIDKTDEKSIFSALKLAIPTLSKDAIQVITEIIDEGQFKGDSNTKQIIRVGSSFKTKYIAIIGLGFEPKKNSEMTDMETTVALKFGRAVGSLSKEVKSKIGGVVLPNNIKNGGLAQFLIGFYDTVYLDRRFRSEEKTNKPSYLTTKLSLLGCSETIVKDADLTHRLTKMIVDGVNFAKDLVMAPPNCKVHAFIHDAYSSLTCCKIDPCCNC